MADVEEYGAELADFRRRVEELRAARTLPTAERLTALDAALFELQHAAEVLWPRYEELAAAGKRTGGRGDLHEQQLLRALFQRLPVGAVLLDREAVVRRMNMAATQLFGLRAGYATGRALTGSLAHEGRAKFRSQAAAVARGEGARSLRVQLLRPPEPDDGGRPTEPLRVTLTALRPPQERRNAVLALFQTAGEGPATPAASGAPPVARHTPRPDLDEMTRQAELLDLVDDMAAALLTTPPVRDPVAARAAGVLHRRFADWVVVDLGDKPRSLVRAAVLGGDEEVRKAVAEQCPSAAPLVVEAVERGSGALQVRLEDPEAFGRDGTGSPVLVRVGASSLICAPLTAGGGTAAEAGDGSGGGAAEYPDCAPGDTAAAGTVVGALTLVRSGSRNAFELAEAGAVERMARHLALALLRSG
ncbi:PAS domain-containing protein [Streptomyces sp. ODS28]|uniref:PAS domain-containing protein n=1 Tax=Streptomyces sp. ODS28 TaxID=3136688 RepID=UPI0031F15CF6